MTREEAIEIIKRNCTPDSDLQKACELFIPELAESEDEKFRNYIIRCCEECDNGLELSTSTTKRLLAYLEKQKKKKDYNKLYENITKSEWFKKSYEGKSLGCDDEQKPAEYGEDERIRKWLSDILDTSFWRSDWPYTKQQVINYLENQKEQIPYTDFVIKPHKGDDTNPYDMSVSEAQEYAINRGFGIPFNDGEVYVDERHMTQTIGNIIRWADEHPKKQKPIMESKRLANEVIKYLTKCGYSPVLKDDSKKEHFHIDIPRHKDDFWQSEEYKHCHSVLGEYYMEGDYGGDTYTLYIWREKKEQKPTWSEEDEKIITAITKALKGSNSAEKIMLFDGVTIEMVLDWLKSLCPQPKQEWSEEDKGILLSVKCVIDEVWNSKNNMTDYSADELEEMWHWLDTLWQRVEYPQPQWKPSEEQMQALMDTLEFMSDTFKPGCTLATLFNDLKKLI